MFNLSRIIHDVNRTIVTLDWDPPPQNGGPEVTVDNYTIIVDPVPLSLSTGTAVAFPPWNVTLAHNVQYVVNITAVNCVGESEPSILSGISFSKCIFVTCIDLIRSITIFK